eukprot:jgi/Phyca11/125587/e_gw1.59.132.1
MRLNEHPAGGIPNPAIVQKSLEDRLQADERLRDRNIAAALSQGIVARPNFQPQGAVQYANRLDGVKQSAFSSLVRDGGYSLVELVELVRGQTLRDRRPNKALCPRRYGALLNGYRHQRLLQSIAEEGILPRWRSRAPQQRSRPPNHHSATRHLSAVVASIRAGQDNGQYLVLDEDLALQWPNVQVSPFGAVPKKGIDPSVEVRLIHDLSFPRGDSTNDASDKSSFPNTHYTAVAAIARRIDECAARHPGVRICIAKGDVKGSFRHLMLSSNAVCWMGGLLPDHRALIIDMSAPFGWSGSPPFYSAFGGAISWLVGNESPYSLSGGVYRDSEPFFPYEWVDDHILVEADTPGRLVTAMTALRLAMLAVLGPRAINEKKFSQWSTSVEVLGLEFDTEKRTVSMPEAKIRKAQARVEGLAASKDASRHDLECLLGCLRHVSACLR